MLVQRYF